MWFISYIHVRAVGINMGRHDEYEYNNIITNKHPFEWLAALPNGYDEHYRILFFYELTLGDKTTRADAVKFIKDKTHTIRQKPYVKEDD